MMTATLFARVRDAPVTHVLVAVLVCFFVLSPALFTPWGFGPDYTNHLWLIWQQGLAISDTGHPTLYLQTPDAIFEPFYGFYGGTLYATAGALSAILGEHPYPVYIASIGASAVLAYGGVWWLGRQLGLSLWVAHLPAIIFVTGAYYLTDAYARGAWPELVALSAVPMFIAGGARLLTGPWRAGPVALFMLGTVVMTGSHNLTLFWSAVLIGPAALAAWIAAGKSRPSLRSVMAVAALAALAAGINAWFLVLDMYHSGDTLIGASALLDWGFTDYFNKLDVIFDPLRRTPGQSGTYGLTPAAPVAAFAFSLILVVLAWPGVRHAGGAIRALWLILLAAIVVIVVMMIMPGSWWNALGRPFIFIQFPYRLAGFLLIAMVAQLAISLRFARDLTGTRRQIAVGLGLVLLVVTLVQASAQMYSGPRLDGSVNAEFRPQEVAFVNGPTAPPASYYSPPLYADASQPVVVVPRGRRIALRVPEPGQTRLVEPVRLPRGSGPIATNIAAGPYVARVKGMKLVGRTDTGMMVVESDRPNAKRARLTVVADGGTLQMVATVVSILCLIACLGLVALLTVRSRLRASQG